MLKNCLAGLIIILLSAGCALAKLNPPYVDGDSIVAEAQGRGKTLTAAKIDARRSAAQLALGFLLEGTSMFAQTLDASSANNKRKLDERILRLSRAFIAAGEEELDRKEDDRTHIFSVALRVKVSGAELLNGLLHKPPEISRIDGASLVADAISRLNWQQEVASSSIELFNAFNLGDYVRVIAENDGGFDVKNERMNFNIKFMFDTARYFNEAVPSIVSVLDYISDFKIKDLPFNLPAAQAVIKLDEQVKTIAQYQKLLEIDKANRAVNNTYANIYIQTDGNYFNAYRLNKDAFRQLAQSLFNSNLSGMKGRAELAIDFVNDAGRSVRARPAGIKNMTGIMFFMMTPPKSLFTWRGSNLLDDEAHCALLILPAFAFDNDNDSAHGFTLYREDTARLANVKVSAEELLTLGAGSSARCAIIMKR